ncbi:hypothetical protein MRX96_056562 [Rhipicephalus microplus]
MDPYLNHFVQMEVGTVAHYSGIYTGPNEIAVVAPGGVRDLGRPKHSGTVIRIAIRKTLNNYTFFADYATEPVIGKYQDLVVSGHEYTPRFSMNFNIRHVYMTDVRSTPFLHITKPPLERPTTFELDGAKNCCSFILHLYNRFEHGTTRTVYSERRVTIPERTAVQCHSKQRLS